VGLILVDAAEHQLGAVGLQQLYGGAGLLGAELEVHRVQERLAGGGLQRLLHHGQVGSVGHQRQAHGLRQAGQEGLNVVQLVPFGIGKAHVQHVRARGRLGFAQRQRAVPVPRGHHVAELLGTDGIIAFSGHHGRLYLVVKEGFHAGDHPGDGGRERAGLQALHGGGEGLYVPRAGAAAAAGHVQQAALHERGHGGGEPFRGFQVAAVLVRQAGVGHGENGELGPGGQPLQAQAQAFRAGGAVEPYGGQREMFHGGVKSFGVVAREHFIGGVHGGRDHHRDFEAGLLEGKPHGGEAGLEVQDVVRGLEQQDVGAAIQQGSELLQVDGAQVVEGEAAGNEEGFIGGTYGPGHVSLLTGGGIFIRRGAGELYGGQVEFAHAGGEAVFGEHGGVGAEGIGLHEVGAGGEVVLVDLLYHFGFRHGEDLVQAFMAGIVGFFEAEALEVGAHGPVENGDALR
jgi:hypothetical protein